MVFKLTILITLFVSITIFILTYTGVVLETVFGGRDELNSTKYCFSLKWGSEGTANGQFLRPHDVSFDSKGSVYVVDRGNQRMQVFSPC